MSKTPYLKSQTRQTDWCVVIPKLAESLYDRVADRLIQHFSLTPQEAQETIQHTPIILLDDLDHDIATKVKAVFEGTGVELILTQDPSFKKKCFRVLWPKESAEVLSRWRGESSSSVDEPTTSSPSSAQNPELDVPFVQEHGQDDKGLKKRISELEARLKIAEARDKELQGELDKREKNSRSREEVLQQEKKVSQKLQGLFDQGQKESSEWMRKAERSTDRIKALEAEKNDLTEKLQARVREVGNWKIKSDQMDAEREDLSKQLEQKIRELDQRQRAFEQQLAEFDKKSAKDKTGYVDEKKQWSAIHEQFQQEVQAAQRKSTELTEQIKALRRNITDREEASKLSAQSFKDVSRKNQALQQKITQMEGQAFKLEKVREELSRQLNQVSTELGEKNKIYENAVLVYEKRITTLDSESKAEREHTSEEKKSLNQGLSNFRSEIEALVSQKTAVQDCLTETEKRCNQLMESLDVVAKDQKVSLSRIHELAQTEVSLKSQIQTLQNQLGVSLQEKTTQEGSLQQLAARVSELEQLCSRQEGLLQSESAKLTQERDTVERSAARIRQLEGDQLNLEKLLETAGVDYRDAVGRIAGLEKNLSDLTENQKGLEQQLSERTQELDRWRESSEQANVDSSARQARIEELEILKKHAEDHGDKLAASKAALEQQRDDLVIQITELTETRAQLSAQKTERQNQIDDLNSSVKALRANLDKRTQDLDASLREREKQGAEWSAKYNELKEMTDAERESLRLEQSRLENVLQAVREEKTAALKDVSDLESRSAELEQQRVGLSRELADKTEQLSQWTLFAEQSEAKAESWHKIIGELESVKADLLSERDALAKVKSQLEGDKQSLENRLAVTTQERDQLILLRQKLESQTAELQETVTKIEGNLQSSIREREIQDEDWLSKYSQLKQSTDDERQTLSGEKQQLIRSVESLSDDKEFARKAISELELRISELHDTRNLLERDLRNKTIELQGMNERAEESSSLVFTHQKKIEQLEEQIIQLEVERHELNAELSMVKSEFNETKLHKQHLEAAVERWSLEAQDLEVKFNAELEAHEVSRSQQTEQNTQWNQKYNDLAEKSAEAREVFEDERARYEKTLAEVQNDKTEALKEIGRLEERIGSLDRTRIHLEEQLSVKSADYENYFSAKAIELQQWILHSEQAELESATRQKRIEELESIKSQLDSERQSLTESLALMTESRDAAHHEKKNLEVVYLALQEKSSAISTQLAQKTEALKVSIQEGKQQKIDGQKRFDELKNTTDAERQSLLNEKTRLEELRVEIEREKEQALLRIESQDQSIQDLEGRRTALELDLKNKIEELQQWTGLAEQAEAESASRQKEIEKLEIAKASLEDERAVLLAAKVQLESQVELFAKNLSDAAMERERLLEIKQGLEESVTSLESQLGVVKEEFKQSTEKLLDQALSQEKQNDESSEKYDQLKTNTDAERKALLADQQRLSATVNSLQTDKSEALKEIGRLEGRIESLDVTREKLEQSLRIKTEELAEWTQLAEQSELKAEQRHGKIAELEQIRGELESERDSLAKAKGELTDECIQLNVIKTELESERASLLAAKELIETHRSELSVKLDDLTVVRKELEEWKENLETEVEKLEEQRSVLRAELEKRTQELELSRCEGKDQETHWNLKFNALKSASESEQERLGLALQELQDEKENALNQIQQLDGRIIDLSSVRETLEQSLRLKTEDLAQWTQLAEQSEAKAEELQKKIDELEKAKADLEVQRDDLFLSKAQLEDQRDKLLFIKSELESERVAFSDQLVEMTGTRDQLAQAKQALESKAAALESQRQSLSTELEKTRQISAEQNAAWKDKHAALEAASTREQEALIEKQIQLEDSVEQLKTEKAEALHEIDTLESRIHDLDTKSSGLEQDLRLKTEELAQWTQLAEQSEAKAKERQTTIDSLETVRRELESEKEILISVKESLAEHRDQLLGANASLENERDELLTAKAQLESNRTELGQKLSEMTSARQELEEWKENLEAEVEKLEERSRSLAAELTERTKDLEIARLEGNDQDTQWNAKYSELKTESETEQNRLSQTIAGLKDEKSTALSQIQQLDRQMGELNTVRKNLEQDLRLKTEELAQWTQLAEQSEAKAEERQTTIDSLETVRRELESEKEILVSAKESLAEHRDQLLGANASLENERDELLTAKAQLESNRAELGQKLSELTSARQELEEWKENLEAEVEKLEERSRSLAVELAERTKDLEIARLEGNDQDTQWNAKYSELKTASETEQNRLSQTIAGLKDEKSTALSQIQQLDRQMGELNTVRKNLEQDLRLKTEELAQWTQLAEQSEAKAEERQTTIEVLHVERDQLSSDKAELTDDRDRLMALKNDLEREREAWLAANKQLETERDLLSQKLSELTATGQKLAGCKEDLEAEVAKLENRSHRLTVELDQRVQELEVARLEGKDQDTQWNAKYMELKASAEAKQERLGYLIDRLKDDKETASNIIQQLEIRISDLTNDRAAFSKELYSKTEELARWTQLAEQSAQEAKEAKEKIESLNAERNYLFNEKETLVEGRNQLEAAKNNLEMDRDALLAAKAQLESERMRFANKLAEVSEIRDGLEHQKKKTESDLKKLEGVVQKLKMDLENRTHGLAEAQLKSKQDSEVWSAKFNEITSSAQAEREVLLADQARLSSELQKMTEQHLKAEAAITGFEASIRSFEERCQQSDIELQKKSQDLQQWAQLAEQVEAKSESWHKQVDMLEKAKRSLESQCDALRAAKNQLDIERQAVEQKLEQVMEEKDKAIAQGQNLQMALQEMQSQQSLLSETLSGKQRELEQSLQSRKDSETKWSEKFQELSAETSAESQTLSVEIDKLKSSIKNLKIEKTNALKEIEELGKLNEVLEQNRSGLERELNVRTAELKTLSDWSTQTEAKVKEQQKRMESLEASKADIQHEFDELIETQKGFEKDLRDSTAELSRVIQRIEHADIAAELAAKRAAELEAAKNEAEERCKKLADEVDQMAREKKTLVQQVVEIQAGLNSLEMENSLSSLESRRKFLETELDSRAKEVEKWMESAKLAENETQKVKEERQAFTKKYEALEKKCSALEAELKPLLNTPKQIGQKDREITRLEAELKVAAAAREAAVQESKQLVEQNEKKLAALAQDWDQRQNVLKSAITREREDYERERADLRTKQDKLRKLDGELSLSHEKIVELEASRNELQKKLAEIQSETLRHSKPQPDQDQARIRQELDCAQQEIKKLTAKYHALEEIKNEFVALLGSERKRYDSLQGQYDQLKDRFGELVRKQTESVSFDRPPATGKKQSPSPSASGGDNSDTEKMLRLKQILDFEDNRRGSKDSDSK